MNYIVQNKNSNYKEEINNIINSRKKEIFSFFNSEEIDLNSDIYIYDSIEELVNGLKSRGFKNDPDYMCACFKDEDNSLNFFEPKDNPGDKEWSKEEYKNVIFHELIHCIQFKLFGHTYEWLNEGIAKYLDGTYSKGIKYLLDNYINNIVPNQKEIEEEFGMHEYDSYDYAYLMVSYLIDTLGKDKFIAIIKENKIDDYKDNLLNKAIVFYNKKSNIEYKTIYIDEYIKNKELYLNLIKEMFKNDNDKLANLEEIRNHLDFIFNSKYKLNAFLILLMENDKLISMINGYEYDNVNNEWCLLALFVKKTKRKLGYGEKILKCALNEIKKYPYSKIIVGIEEENISSIKLHEKVGFKYAFCNWDELAPGFPENHLGYYLTEFDK